MSQRLEFKGEADRRIRAENLLTFVGFAGKRLGDPHLAEDAVQESFVKALASAKQPTNEEDMVAWFYRILRRSIIELQASRSEAMRRDGCFQIVMGVVEWGGHLCLPHSLLPNDSVGVARAAGQAEQSAKKRQRDQRRPRPFRLYQRDEGADGFVFRFHRCAFRFGCFVAASEL